MHMCCFLVSRLAMRRVRGPRRCMPSSVERSMSLFDDQKLAESMRHFGTTFSETYIYILVVFKNDGLYSEPVRQGGVVDAAVHCRNNDQSRV